VNLCNVQSLFWWNLPDAIAEVVRLYDEELHWLPIGLRWSSSSWMVVFVLEQEKRIIKADNAERRENKKDRVE